MAETKPLCWELEATLEVSITMTKKVRVKSQAEAEHHCQALSKEARARYPSGYIGCGVIAVRLADDADAMREKQQIRSVRESDNAIAVPGGARDNDE